MMSRVFIYLLLTISTGVTRAHAEDPPDLSRDYLSLVARHLYRWHMDETSLSHLEDLELLDFMYRWRPVPLDEGDNSRYIELIIPALKYQVLLKKADYVVPELETHVVNRDYRIVRAGLLPEIPETNDDYVLTTIPIKELIAHLFSLRNERVYPDESLSMRMRLAFRERYLESAEAPVQGPQTVYVAPLSPVANHLWVFWENEGRIIRFSSDSDIATPAFWEVEKLGVDLYDLDQDVVVAMAEAPGSNAYITRDWAARVLYNCVVFGKRMILNPDELEANAERTESDEDNL